MNNNFSITGYKDNSPDKNNSYNVIPGRNITMKGVSKQLTLVPIVNGKPQYDRKRLAKPGDEDIEFESDVEGVLELPYAQFGLNPYTFQNSFATINNMQNMFTPDATGAMPGTSYAENARPEFQNPYVNPQANTINPTVTPTSTGNGIPPMVNFAPPTAADIQAGQQRYLQGVDNRARTAELGTDALPSVTGDPNQRQLQEDAQVKANTQQRNRNSPFIGAINPYGGWNMENTAVALGAFAQNKNILGTVAAAGKLVLSGARNYLTGSAAAKNYQESLNEYYDKEEENQRSQGWHWLQKGGKIGKILTGNFIEGDEDHQNPNTEVEKGEYLQTPDGSTMEVLGKKHAEGGELLNMPGGTKVVSDYLKIGAKLATYFKKEHGLNVKSSNSFATVLDKYKKKIGLTELLDDESKLMDKLNAQEDVEFEGTREINQQVLSEKINELQGQKQELENRFENFTNIVFDKQEETKEPGGKNFEKQVGGEVEEPQSVDENAQPVEQQPGNEIQQLIMQFAQITGQDPEQIIMQLQQLPEDQLQGAIQQMMDAVQQAQSPEQVPQDPNQQVQDVNAYNQPADEDAQPQMRRGGDIVFAQSGIVTPRSEFDTFRANYVFDPNYEYGNLSEEAKAIIPFLKRNGIEYNPEDLKTQAGLDRLAGLAQQSFRTNFKGVSNDYSSKVAATQQGLQTALDSGLVTQKELTDLGVKVNKGQVLRGSKGIIPKENENKVVDLITAKGKDNPTAYNQYVDKNFVDNKWYFRNPDIRTVEFNTQQEIDDYVKKNNFNVVEDVNGKKIYNTDKQGLYFKPVLKSASESPATQQASASQNTPNNPDPNTDINPLGNRDRSWNDALPMLTPDQSNLPPNYLATTLRQVGHVQANPIAVSPIETIKELNRQYVTASNLASETNPYTSGAMQATLQAQTNNATNQAYTQAAIANAQDERNVANINEERIQARDNANLNLMGQYEKEAIVGLDNYVQSWRNYIDKRNLENVNNFNLENQRAAFNAVNDNYKIGSMGWYQTSEQPIIYYTGQNGETVAYNQRTKQSQVVSRTNPDGTRTTTKTETTTPKSKKGGLLLSKDVKNWLR